LSGEQSSNSPFPEHHYFFYLFFCRFLQALLLLSLWCQNNLNSLKALRKLCFSPETEEEALGVLKADKASRPKLWMQYHFTASEQKNNRKRLLYTYTGAVFLMHLQQAKSLYWF